MSRATSRLCLILVVMAASMVAAKAQPIDADEAAAMGALDAFIEGFNSRDPKKFASALHFPHVVIEGGTIRYFPTEQEYIAPGNGLWSSVQPEWDRSVWDDRRVVQKLPNTVHVAGRWARLDKNGKVIAKADVMYVVSQKAGKWAIVARSGSRGAQKALRPQ